MPCWRTKKSNKDSDENSVRGTYSPTEASSSNGALQADQEKDREIRRLRNDNQRLEKIAQQGQSHVTVSIHL